MTAETLLQTADSNMDGLADHRAALAVLESALTGAGYDLSDFGQFLQWRDKKNGSRF